MLFALLNSASSSGTNGSGGCFSKENLPMTFTFLGFLLIFVVLMVFSRRSQAKKQKEQMDRLNSIQPGNKVKTIGGICGVVVEVCPEENTFVLETGTEASGKSYIKFDKQAIYQTDAGLEPAPVEDTAVIGEDVAEEPAIEEPIAEEVVEVAEEPASEQPAAEEVFEEVKED